MKKILTAFIILIFMVGCSNNNDVAVKTIEDYEKVYLADAKDIIYSEDGDGITSSFGGINEYGYNCVQSSLSISSNSEGNIENIYMNMYDVNMGTDEYRYHINGFLKYVDSLNTRNPGTTEYSDIIRKSIETAANTNFMFDEEFFIIDNEDIIVKFTTPCFGSEGYALDLYITNMEF